MSIGEIAKIALIDTGLGMGTVFAVLILISIVIWLLGIICRKKPAADTGAEAAEEQAVRQDCHGPQGSVVKLCRA